MRVLIVHPTFAIYGGAELVIVRLANYLTERGIDNAILTTAIPPEVKSDLRKTDVMVVKSMPANGIGEIIALHRGISRMQRDFDVINIHNFPAEIAVFGSRKRVVWMCNEPELDLGLELAASVKFKLFLRALLPFERFVVRQYISEVVVADAFNAKRFEGLYGIKPRIIHYGIDSEFFSNDDAENARDLHGLRGKFVILHAGMITPLKNQRASIETLQELKGRIPNVKLVLAGTADSEYAKTLGKYVDETGLKDDVLFTGHVNREKMRDLYHACDVLLHPIKEQGGWLSPFEALCAGKVVIVSKEMTASDMIQREGIGVVTDKYVESILAIYENPIKYREIAVRGAEFVRRNLSWNNFCENMAAVFYETCSEAPPGG